MAQDSPERHLVKRYAQGRLYDTYLKVYVDVAYLRALVWEGAEVTVIDARTGDDITEAILDMDMPRRR